MNKTKKNYILALVSLFVLMMTEASVNADDEPNLISPGPNDEEEPLIIAPIDTIGNKDVSSEDNTAAIVFVAGIAGFVGLAAALIIFKKKN